MELSELPQPQQNQPLLIKAATLSSQDDFEIIKTTIQKQGNIPKIGTKLRKSASMKLKRSWFPAFRLGGNSHQVQVTEKPSNSSAQTLPNSAQNSAKTSTVRRSSSRLNVNSSVALNPSADDYGAAGTGTPILLSVRKRSTSDSGYSGEDTCCDSPVITGAHGGLHHNNNSATTSNTTTSSTTNNPSSKNSKSSSSSGSNHGLSFLRLFHKSSATLQLQHPKAGELNPNMKPYKGTVMTSMDHQRKKKEFLKRKLPLVPMASSSLSSLNTLANENVGHPVHKNMNCSSSNPLRANRVHHSSSNSVISSSGEDSTTTTESSEPGTSRGCSSGSNYDSGAFSRSSSPVMNVNNVSLSMSRLALTEPLVAPRLVLAASRGEWPINEEMPLTLEEVQEVEKIKSKARLYQLQAAHRKKVRARSMSAVRKDAEEEQVTVSVGDNSMLTIGSPDTSSNSSSRLSNLRRSRSGLPVLGMNALRPSPVKPMRSSMTASNIRTKISTVYLTEAPTAVEDSKLLQPNYVESTAKSRGTAVINRSSSIVTVMGSKPSGIKCECTERVTVNGQHHCSKVIRDLNQKQCSSEKRRQGRSSTCVTATPITTTAQVNAAPANVVDRSTNTTPITVLSCNNNQMDYQHQKQPSSIIEI